MKKGIISFILLLFIPFIACAESYVVTVTVGVEYYLSDDSGIRTGTPSSGPDIIQTFYIEAETQDKAETQAKLQCNKVCSNAQIIKRGIMVEGKKYNQFMRRYIKTARAKVNK